MNSNFIWNIIERTERRHGILWIFSRNGMFSGRWNLVLPLFGAVMFDFKNDNNGQCHWNFRMEDFIRLEEVECMAYHYTHIAWYMI